MMAPLTTYCDRFKSWQKQEWWPNHPIHPNPKTDSMVPKTDSVGKAFGYIWQIYSMLPAVHMNRRTSSYIATNIVNTANWDSRKPMSKPQPILWKTLHFYIIINLMKVEISLRTLPPTYGSDRYNFLQGCTSQTLAPVSSSIQTIINIYQPRQKI